jgi:hypothetical protein
VDLERQVALLEGEYEAACGDCAADMGEEAVDQGGWVELARAVAAMPPEGVTEEAVVEFLRRQGLDSVGGYVDWDAPVDW